MESWGEYFSLAAAEECLRRLDRLAPHFTALCRDPENWLRFECGYWPVFHAWLVLAESGRAEFAGTLFEGARRLVVLESYNDFGFDGDSCMATLPSLFLDIVGEAACDARQDPQFHFSSTFILGIALLTRQDRKVNRAEALMRVFRNPKIGSSVRTHALKFLVRSEIPWVLENLREGPFCTEFSREVIEHRIKSWRLHPEVAWRLESPFAYYGPDNSERRFEFLRSHRGRLAMDIQGALHARLDARASETLKRFESSLPGLSPAARAGHILVARWFLARESMTGQSLAGLRDHALSWFLHRLVYERHHVEGAADVDFWDAVERFLEFAAAQRKVSAKRLREWRETVARWRHRYGTRGGF